MLLLVSCSTPFPPASKPIPTLIPTSTSPAGFRVVYHPDGPLYVGDQVSMEVISPASFDSEDRRMRVSLDETVLGETDFGLFGIGGRRQATFYWVWDTEELDAGLYTLDFSVLPDGPHWSQSVSLLPESDVPAPEPGARWESVDTDCCTIHYVTGTDAARDIEALKSMADAEAEDVEERLGAVFDDKVPLTFLPRVLGQGGFASSGLYVSYLDQNYMGSSIATAQIIHHEFVHWLDNQMGSETRISMLSEGLAVYFSDGHFKKEPIMPRAAALLGLEWYVPLAELADSFYDTQHEVGYLEAAALTGYMVETYGWEKYNTFYRDLQHVQDGSNADILDVALQEHFDLSLDELEADFVAFLQRQTVTREHVDDVRSTVAFYDAARRYQQALDPSAYFMTAWLPDGGEMRERGIVADYLRHPVSNIQEQIESTLVSAGASLQAGDYKMVEVYVRVADLLLDVAAR